MTAPDTETVFMRAACLWALADRLMCDAAWRARPYDERAAVEAYHRELCAWIDREAIPGAQSPEERQHFASLVGAWPAEKRIDLGWRIECLAVLVWALGLLEGLPPFDTQVGLDLFSPVFGDSFEPLAEVRARARLRPQGELLAARTECEAWHGRAMRAERFFRHAMGRAPPGSTSPKNDPERIRKAIGGDVVLFGKPYSTLDVDEYSVARSIAIERSRALTWLCDGGDWP